MARLCYLGTEDRRAFLQSKAGAGFEIGNIDRQDGPKTIESMYEEYLYIPVMIESVLQAEKEGLPGGHYRLRRRSWSRCGA